MGSTDILHLRNMTWSSGARTIPTSTGEISNVICAAIHTENGHIIVGGNDDITEIGEIFSYDLDTDEWTVLEQRLTKPRQGHVVIPIPRDDRHC